MKVYLQRLISIIPIRFRRLEYIYAATSLIFGLIFILTIPPGWSPDEPQHYWRVQSLAHGNIFADLYHSNNGQTFGGGPLHENTRRFIDSYGGTANPDWPHFTLNFPMTSNAGVFVGQKDEGALSFTIFSATSKNTPFVYLPYIIASWIGNILGFPLLASFILAKLFGLVTQTVAIFFAIRLIPKGKWLLFTLGLLPTAIVQSTALTADVMTLSVCLLFIALVLKVAYSKNAITNRTFAAIFLLVAAIGLVKASYLPLAALLLIIPIMKKEYQNLKILSVLALITIFCALPGVVWLKSVLSIPDYYSGSVIPTDQVHHLIEQPLRFLSVLFMTYFSDAQQIIHRGFFGSFIWDTVQLPLIFDFAGIAAITLAIFTLASNERAKLTLPVSVKILFWGIFALLSALITFALYVYYTPVGGSSAGGIQGRYFLPFALLPLLTVHSSTTPLGRPQRIKLIIYGLLFAMLAAAVFVIIGRIYG